MNAQSIWAGEEYAWAYARPKSAFPRNGIKVTAISTRRKRLYGNERLSTEVNVRLADGTDRWVPARELVDFWDSYKDELDHMLEGEAARRAARDKARQDALDAHEKRYRDYAFELGIARNALISLDDGTATIKRDALEVRLGIREPNG